MPTAYQIGDRGMGLICGSWFTVEGEWLQPVNG